MDGWMDGQLSFVSDGRMDGWMTCDLHPFQQTLSYIRIMGG